MKVGEKYFMTITITTICTQHQDYVEQPELTALLKLSTYELQNSLVTFFIGKSFSNQTTTLRISSSNDIQTVPA